MRWQLGSTLLLALWLGFLFVNLALICDMRVVPNLNSLVKVRCAAPCVLRRRCSASRQMWNMDDSLAGVTLVRPPRAAAPRRRG